LAGLFADLTRGISRPNAGQQAPKYAIPMADTPA
jgi:hypothetical protein